MSYAEALTKAGSNEYFEAIVPKYRLCFADLVGRMGDNRPTKTALLGELEAQGLGGTVTG